MLAGIIFSSCTPSDQKEKQQPVKPNIIYILADDLGFGDLSFQGQEKFQTPNIDKMAGEGLVFQNHYSGSTVCAPSRSTLMTGQHTGHTPIRGNKGYKPEGQHPLPGEAVTVTKLLKEAGYVTGAMGKWGLGFPGSTGDPNNQGFDKFYGFNCQGLAHNYYPNKLWDNRDTVFIPENDNQGTGVYGHDAYHAKALEFIKENKDTNFFLYLPYIIPHAELLVPEDSIFEYYKSILEETEPYKGVDEGPRYRLGGYGSQEFPHAAFAAMVHRLDHSVGEILTLLKELNLDSNTLVIFTSDNGPHKEGGADPEFFGSSRPFRGIKRDLYEGGIHVPFVAWWPGTVSTGTTDHISAFWDLLPTCTELAGIEIPENIDGISFVPILLGQTKDQNSHEYLYWEFHERGTSQAIRMGNWKGIRYGLEEPLELYNLEEDIHEDNNIAEQNQEVVRKLEELLSGARIESEVWPAKAKKQN